MFFFDRFAVSASKRLCALLKCFHNNKRIIPPNAAQHNPSKGNVFYKKFGVFCPSLCFILTSAPKYRRAAAASERIDRVFTPADSLFKGRGGTCIEYKDKPNMTEYRPRRRTPIFSTRPLFMCPCVAWTENGLQTIRPIPFSSFNLVGNAAFPTKLIKSLIRGFNGDLMKNCLNLFAHRVLATVIK